MSETPLTPESTPDASEPPEQYVVVARRYRPQTFDELIGQEHVAQALSNAISSNRVGHAYLFTGSRGVGKTSAARIFAKALNCEQGSSPVSCNQCDICQTIGSGEDVDVLEIDGASNRGIDEIRQLRQNVNVRPSRSRHKIY
ncbi:MAG: DNA polymerase III subunit gamma/tau, partial [Thermoguttaceae bacterium]